MFLLSIVELGGEETWQSLIKKKIKKKIYIYIYIYIFFFFFFFFFFFWLVGCVLIFI